MLRCKPMGLGFAFSGLVLIQLIPSCSSNERDGAFNVGGSTAQTGGTTAQGGTTAAVTTHAVENGESVSIDLGTVGTGGTTSTSPTSTVVECTEGEGCDCPKVTMAVIGKAGKWGANPDGDSDTAFQDWLNSSSTGTAQVDNIAEKPTLTKEFLAKYNVIVLAGLGDDSNEGPFWKFDSAEQAEIWAWVEAGGGLLSLSGYAANPEEVLPKNQLLAFANISYNQDGVTPKCLVKPENGGEACWCGGSSSLSEFNREDPFVANLSNSVTWVGLQSGRSINAPPDAVVAATASNAGQAPANVLVGKAVGNGRVLVYADEWITYTSQWSGEGNPNTTNTACTGLLPQDVYQTAQFWYNMIKWLQPKATCFKIIDTTQPVIPWPVLQ